MQPLGVDLGDVAHVDILAVNDLGVHHVGRHLHGVKDRLGVNFQRDVASDRLVDSGGGKVGCIGEEAHCDGLEDRLLVGARDNRHPKPFQDLKQLLPEICGPGQNI